MVRFTSSHVKPALKGEVDMSVSEWTEGLHQSCSCLRQPLGRSALRRFASSLFGEPFSLPPTKSCPRLRGKCRGVAVTKGERLGDAEHCEMFPLSLFAIAHRQLPRRRWSLFIAPYRASSILFKNSSSGAKRRLCSLPLRRNMSVCEDFALSVLSAPARVKGMPSG